MNSKDIYDIILDGSELFNKYPINHIQYTMDMFGGVVEYINLILSIVFIPITSENEIDEIEEYVRANVFYGVPILTVYSIFKDTISLLRDQIGRINGLRPTTVMSVNYSVIEHNGGNYVPIYIRVV